MSAQNTQASGQAGSGSISPGPWKVYPSGRSVPGYDVCDRIVSDKWTGRSLSLVGCSDADARLIAAAPELLAALREIAALDGAYCGVAVELARAALTKAEVRS
jgi:hypothetical protein